MGSGWERYYEVVRRIPRGRVTNYGTVAELAGAPRTARQVGYALAALHGRDAAVPWHRVLGADGPRGLRILLGLAPGEPGDEQRRLLEAEGVDVDGRGRVDAARHGWDDLADREEGPDGTAIADPATAPAQPPTSAGTDRGDRT